jgi:hypothetical protein
MRRQAAARRRVASAPHGAELWSQANASRLTRVLFHNVGIRAMLRLILYFSLGLGLASCVDQSVRAEDRAYLYSHRPIHGWGSTAWETRVEISRDRAILSLYQHWLANPERAPQGVHIATMLWWLGESGDPTYVPTLIRFSTDQEYDWEVFTAVVYGLARTARDSTARAALENMLAGNLSNEQANAAAAVLMHVGDEHARSLLRRFDGTDLGPFVRTGVAEVLSSPGNATERWPCAPPLGFAKGADGRFGCRSAIDKPSA